MAVDCVPPGCVVSYGDVAALVGTGPRVVGRVLARYGSDVAWWRVTNAAGRLPEALLREAAARWRAEAIEVNVAGTGCRIVAHRAALPELAIAYEHRLPPELREPDAV